MFKRIKENEKYQKFKELWDNPRTHAAIVLVFWLLFMVGAIIFVRLISTPSKEVKTELPGNTFSSIKSYEFTYLSNTLEVNGQSYGEAIEFYLGNKRYYVNNNIYLIDKDQAIIQNEMDLSILKITNKMLNNLTSGIDYTTVQDGKRYVIPLDRFINLYEIDTDADLSKAMNYNIVVTIYEKNKKIYKVDLDLSNYVNFKNGTNVNYPVTIYYYNINNVSDFTKEYGKMIGVK